MKEKPERDDSSERPEGSDRRVSRWKIALFGVAVLVVASIPLWSPLLLRHVRFFHVRRVEIVGTRYIAATDILSRANVDTMRSVWDPLKPIAARVKTHPGVQSAVVSRKLPGTLVITVTEYQPIALVPGPQGFRVFDERGVALPIDPSKVDVDAPVLATADVPMLQLLAGMRGTIPDLYRRLSELRRVGRYELLLQVGETPVRAMASVTLDELNQLAPIEADLRMRSVRVRELDLRYKDQIIARLQ